MALNHFEGESGRLHTSKRGRSHYESSSPVQSSVPSISSKTLRLNDVSSPSPHLPFSSGELRLKEPQEEASRQSSERFERCNGCVQPLSFLGSETAQVHGQLPSSILYPDGFGTGRLSSRTLTRILTLLLHSRCRMNERSCSNPRQTYRTTEYPDGSSSLFHSVHVPSIPLHTYVSHFVNELNVAPSVYVTAFVYLDRVATEDCVLSLTYLNVHRLFTTAVTLATKFMEDDSFSNAFLGRLGGIPSTFEMNLLELQFLRRLHWNCFVSKAAYTTYAQHIVSKHSSFYCHVPHNIKFLSRNGSDGPS